MSLPAKVLELILFHCDGKTLLRAHEVDKKFRKAANHVTEKTNVWERICNDEIPRNDLLQYSFQYPDENKWLSIYLNWLSWEQRQLQIVDQTHPIIPDMSDFDVRNGYIAVGFPNGTLKILDEEGFELFFGRIFDVRLKQVSFFDCTKTEGKTNMILVATFGRGLKIVFIDDFVCSERDEIFMGGIRTYSIFRNYIGYEHFAANRFIISKLDMATRKLTKMWHFEKNSECNLSPEICMNMWEGMCLFLINGKIKIARYDSLKFTPNGFMENKTKLKFGSTNDGAVSKIFRNDVMITLYQDEQKSQSDIEFFLLDGKKNTKGMKMFDVLKTLNCFISYIYMYGNILLIGTKIGTLYVYYVSDWEDFELKNHRYKFAMGDGPIKRIAVTECDKGRYIYVALNAELRCIFTKCTIKKDGSSDRRNSLVA